jgi:hypothetical protein
MRTLRVVTAAAAAITATLFFAQGANADRICKQRCEGRLCAHSWIQTHARGENLDFRNGRATSSYETGTLRAGSPAGP